MAELKLKELEKKAYTTSHEDGIIDLMVGFILTLAGTMILTGQSAMIGMIWLFSLFIKPLKKKITFPRVGYVEFAKPQKEKISRMFIYFAISGIIVFFLVSSKFLSPDIGKFIIENFILIIGISLGGMALIVGRMTAVKRGYFYGILVLALFVSELNNTLSFPYALLILGIVMFCTGAVLLIRFIKKYPIVKQDV